MLATQEAAENLQAERVSRGDCEENGSCAGLFCFGVHAANNYDI